MVQNDTIESSNIYKCKTCDYETSRHSQFSRHLLSRKHKMNVNGTNNVPKNEWSCECGKRYRYSQGLSRHKKTCNLNIIQEPNLNKNVPKISSELIVKLITENEEMKKIMLKENLEMKRENQELRKQITVMIPLIGNTNNINNTSIKQKFNINFFLNEKCKDALTMNEFIDKIDISMKNLLVTTNEGLGNGLTNIIMDNMNKLSLYERPIHCTDKNRETIYIKNDSWEKDEDNKQINNMINKVENKQIRNINKWIEANPKYMENEILKREFIKLTTNCASSIDNCKDKIVKNVCDKVYINKDEI